MDPVNKSNEEINVQGRRVPNKDSGFWIYEITGLQKDRVWVGYSIMYFVHTQAA